MKIGFIGAGKVGCCLGQYFIFHKVDVAGYYSRSEDSAKEAANLTNTKAFPTMEEMVQTCDTLFLTVPDGQIGKVWEQLKTFPIHGKVFCHCSGSLSTDIFLDIHKKNAYGYSIHPIYPFHSKQISYEQFQKAWITVEGDSKKKEEMISLFEGFGNQVKSIEKESKVKYHAAAVMAANQVIALMEGAFSLLEECHFTRKEAMQALYPLVMDNMENIWKVGTTQALTGPVERDDVTTVQKHLQELDGTTKEVYIACTKVLLEIAKKKHKDLDETKWSYLLGGKKR